MGVLGGRRRDVVGVAAVAAVVVDVGVGKFPNAAKVKRASSVSAYRQCTAIAQSRATIRLVGGSGGTVFRTGCMLVQERGIKNVRMMVGEDHIEIGDVVVVVLAPAAAVSRRCDAVTSRNGQ